MLKDLALYYTGDDWSYLIVSIKESSLYVAFERDKNNKYIESLKISSIIISGIDSISIIEEIDVTNCSHNTHFPYRVFITQGDKNNDLNKN